jgi:cell division protein FtsB
MKKMTLRGETDATIYVSETVMRPPTLRYAFASIVVLLTVYALWTLQGPFGIPALVEKRRTIQAFERQNAELALEIERKRGRIQRLRESQSEQELEIRQRLKLMRPKEKVFILQDQAAK